MGFKAKNKDPYNRWRLKHLDHLQRAGVPHDVVMDNHRFWFVVQEGCDLCHSGWDTTWISDEQACDLLHLLGGFLAEDSGWDLIDELHRKLGRQRTEK